MAGFMAGFGTTLSQLIEEDRKYYRDAAAKRRDYIQTYGTRAVTEREDKALFPAVVKMRNEAIIHRCCV